MKCSHVLAVLFALVALLPVRTVAAAAVEIMKLNADAGVLKTGGGAASNGDGVATWTDQTGNNNNAAQATGANQPVLATNALNGHAVVQFTGDATVGQYMNMNIGTGTPVAQQYTVFLVGNIHGNDSSNATDYFFDSPLSSPSRVLLAINPSGTDQTQLAIYAQGSNVLAVPEAKATWQQYNIYEAVFNGSSSQIYINGVLHGSGSSGIPGTGSIEGLLLGARQSISNFLNGDIATMQVWQGDLTGDQQNAIGFNLQGTYGITGAYVPEPSSWLLISIAAMTAAYHGRGQRPRSFGLDAWRVYRSSWLRTAVLVGFVMLAAAVTCPAATLSFDSNVAGAQDATIIGASFANTNFNSYTGLEVDSPTTSRSLVQFNVSALAGDYSAINAITLRLTTSYNTGNVGELDVHQMLDSWLRSDVTFNDRTSGTPWTTVGGDFAATVLGSIDLSTLSQSAAFDGVDPQVTISILPGAGNAAARKALIDSWTTGSNFGLMLNSAVEPAVGSTFAGFRDASRTDAGDRPLLTVDFVAVPEPGSFMLLAVGLVGFVAVRCRAIDVR